eukprot:jgi/Botrbrau1/4600/Bobra.60_2s0085.1
MEPSEGSPKPSASPAGINRMHPNNARRCSRRRCLRSVLKTCTLQAFSVAIKRSASRCEALIVRSVGNRHGT